MPIEMAPPTGFGQLPQIQPPQSDNNLLQLAQQGQALQQAKQMSPYQVASAQQQVQSQQLANQQQQLQMQSQQGLMKMYLSQGGNVAGMTPQLASQYGVLPADYAAMQKNLLDMAQKKADTSKTLTDTQVAQQGLMDEWHDTLHNAYAPILEEPDPAKQAQMLGTANQNLQTRFPGKAAGDLITDPTQLEQAMAAYTTDKWTTAQAALITAKSRQGTQGTGATKEAAELPGQQAASDQAQRTNTAAVLSAIPAGPGAQVAYDAARDKYVGGGGNAAVFPPSAAALDQNGQWQPNMQGMVQRAGLTPEQRTQAGQAAANAAQNALPKTEPELALIVNDPTKPQALRDSAAAAMRTLTQAKIAARPVTNVNTTVPGLGTPAAAGTALSGQAYLDSLPAGTSAQVRAIAEGRAVMPSATSRSQAAMQLRNGVFQYDPSYSDQRAQVLKAFTTGADGRNIGALNTAAVHLDQFADAANAMNNNTFFTPGNAVMNSLKATFGSAAPANFQALKTAVAGEMASALKGNATDPEIANVSRAIDGANSPAQLQGVVETNLHVLGAKLSTYQQRVQQQIPGILYSPVLPAAGAVFAKHGFNPTAQAAPAGGANGGGGQYVRNAVGANGHAIGQTADGKWHDVATGAVIQ